MPSQGGEIKRAVRERIDLDPQRGQFRLDPLKLLRVGSERRPDALQFLGEGTDVADRWQGLDPPRLVGLLLRGLG